MRITAGDDPVRKTQLTKIPQLAPGLPAARSRVPSFRITRASRNDMCPCSSGRQY
jgi:uncharacterized protein YecA (UPF0149 family)